MKYIINAKQITLFFKGEKPVNVLNTDKLYNRILSTFENPLEKQESLIRDILNTSKEIVTETLQIDEFVFSTDGSVSYKGENLPKPLARKLHSIRTDGLSLKLFVNFWENLCLNPSRTSVEQLFDFLMVRELAITEDGCFLAYKKVESNFYSVTGNTDTKVIRGTVNAGGKIYNGIGEVIQVLRRDVDDDRNNHCSYGLHVGSLSYAKDFPSNSTSNVVIVKVNPKDVVSVPPDANCQKCRVCEYEVVGQFEQEIVASVVDKNNKPIQNEQMAQVDDTFTRIKNYLDKKKDQGVELVRIRQIQNIFRKSPSKETVFAVLSKLSYKLRTDESGMVVIL
jgi:hypothetical protein